MKKIMLAAALIAFSSIVIGEAQAAPQDDSAPTSSLSPNAMTQGANSNGLSPLEVLIAYTQAVRAQTAAPGNAGILSPLSN